ncbi:Putative clathrin assembly protein At5g35200 [Olea europaea subsp. europaea]|uniref:Clathrin assembly protein At5g35200 n=1 Tax=Olea europaea subsp. europaea TaxID=158383 RepID=A0A8S0RSD9_OLEEU|nr:Putative clathrin assembly protein At5g35200 [Olea europaea subsp. europaea]
MFIMVAAAMPSFGDFFGGIVLWWCGAANHDGGETVMAFDSVTQSGTHRDAHRAGELGGGGESVVMLVVGRSVIIVVVRAVVIVPSVGGGMRWSKVTMVVCVWDGMGDGGLSFIVLVIGFC